MKNKSCDLKTNHLIATELINPLSMHSTYAKSDEDTSFQPASEGNGKTPNLDAPKSPKLDN